MKAIVVFHDGYVKIEYQHQGKRTRKSTGVAIPNKTYLKANKQVKSTIDGYERKQKTIDAFLAKANDILDEHLHKYKVQMTGEQFSRAWDAYDSKIKNSKKLLVFYNTFYESKELEFKRVDFNENSIKDYRNIRYYLEDFEASTQKEILLDDINRDWMNKLVYFMETKREDYDIARKRGGKYHSKGGLAGKTIKKRIGLFIGFFNWMHNEKHFDFPMSLKNYFKTLKGSEAIKAVLNKEEVNKLYALKLDNEKLSFIRDLFVFSCFTGMRWDDMLTFNKKDVHIQSNGVKMIEKMAKKTKEWYRVPINSIVSEIIERYNYNFNRENNTTFNEQLKNILVLTEWFNDETKFKDDDGNFLHRWQCISVHRGRDTFITMLVNNRVPLNEIMKYTGHKSVTSLNMYIDKKAEINDYTSELVIS